MVKKRLITGPAGCGSTSLILDRLAMKIRDGKSNEIIVVIPNYNHLRNLQIKLINDFDIPGIQGDMFETTRGLVNRFAPELKIKQNWDTYARLLLKDTLSRPHIELQQEGYKPGFRRRLGHLFHEIRAQYPARKNELLNILTSEFPDGPTGNALVAKIVKAFKEFEKELDKRNLCSPESALFLASEKIKSSGFSGYLFITGFDDLEEPQLAILSALIDVSKEVIVTLPGGDDWQFEQSRSLRQKFLDMGFEEEKLSNTKRFSNESLLKLEEMFRTSEKLSNFNGISLNLIDGEREEVDYVTRRVASMIENGFSPEEMLLIHPNPISASTRFRAAFAQLGIPFKTDVEKPIREMSPARDLIAVLSLINGDFELAASLSISRYAKPIRELFEHIDKKTLEILYSEENAESPDNDVKDSWNLLKSLISKSKNIRSIKDFSEFVKFTIQKTIFMPQEPCPDCEKLASSSWNSLVTILDEMSDYYSEQKTASENNYESFLSDFIIEIRNSSVKSKDRRKSTVSLVGFEESRLKEARVVFLTGMNDVNFPPRIFTDPLLGDTTRQELTSRGFRFRTAASDIDRNQYLLYSALTRAREKLFITCPVIDEQGEPLEISPSIIGFFPLSEWKNITHQPRPLFTFDDLVTASAVNLDSENDKIKEEIFTNLERHYPRGLNTLIRPNPLECDIKTEIKKAKSYNATKLDRYVVCPFIYFAQYMLRIHEAQTGPEKVFNPLVRGNAVHEYLASHLGTEQAEIDFREILVKLLAKDGYSLDDLDFGEESYVFDIETVLKDFVATEKENIQNEKFVIKDVEFQFGTPGNPSVKFIVEDGERFFSGRIDRIDKLPNDSYTVYDYKSASSTNQIREKFNETMKFQIPVYIMALKQLGYNLSRAGIIVIARNGFKIRTNEDIKIESLSIETIENAGKIEISQVVRSIESGSFPPQPTEKSSCGWDKCGYYHVCRIS